MPVPCFLLFLGFRKVTQEIFSKLDEIKAEPPIFTEASRRPKMRRRGARGQPHHRGARPSPWPRPPMVRPPGPPPDDTPSPIKSPWREKPKGRRLGLGRDPLWYHVESLGGNEYLLGYRVACYIDIGKTATVVVHMCIIRVEYYSIPCSTYYID
jgi:hypothetical protein